MKKLRNLYSGFMLLSLAGCSTYGVIDNQPLDNITDNTGYSWVEWNENDSDPSLSLSVTFSGGGTRAAALSYGVLKGLRETTVKVSGKSVQLIDEIDEISSVSGGSFTAAYYGLYGEGIFDDFKDTFLTRAVEQDLFWGLFSPFEWFKSGGRTEMAVHYYDKNIFHNATFSDIKKDGPLIIINASGLGNGVRFSFVQEYFNFLCSDLESFSISRAVTASSSVPVLFQPIVVERYQDCGLIEPELLKEAKLKANKNDNPLLKETVKGLDILLNKDQLNYIHLVDGGITDNLGLHALYDMVTLSGGAKKTLENRDKKPPKYLVIISVNSSTNPVHDMDKSTKEPSISETLASMSGVQLHRYNSATLDLMERTVKKWAEELSTPEHPVNAYFINVSLEDIVKPELRLFFNQIPTSFGLSEETVDHLINAGVELLHRDPEYQRLVSDMKGTINNKN